MSKELIAFTDTSLTLYAILLNSVGQAYNGSTFEAINGANWTNYDLAMTEGAAGIYTANMPAVAAGAYSYAVYSQAGASPAITDTLKGNGYIQWDGSTEIILNNLATSAEISALNNFNPATQSVIVGTNNDKTGYALSSTGVDAIIDEVIEGTLTLRQALRIMMSVLFGKSSGGGTGSVQFRDVGDTKNRITATVDVNGNRTGISSDGT